MIMPITHGADRSPRKQISTPESWTVTKKRIDTTQSALVAVSEAVGFSRSLFRHRGPWDEARRNPKGYEPHRPYLKEDEMLHDLVSTTAYRGTEEEKLAVRTAVIEYFGTRCHLTLEPLDQPCSVDVLALAIGAKKEVHDAECAALRAVTSSCPEAHATAAREHTEAITLLERLRDAFHIKSRTHRHPSVAR